MYIGYTGPYSFIEGDTNESSPTDRPSEITI